MINVSFDDYTYFPALRTRQAELKGLEQLSKDQKQQFLPMLTLGRWPKATDFNKSAEKAEAAMEKLPHVLDLTNDASHLGDEQRKLRNSKDAFAAWRDFAAQYENAIPVIQLVPGSKARDQVRQATLLEKVVGKIAFRIRDFAIDTPQVINAISAMDDPANALVYIDCQYIRSALAAYVTATVATVNQLRAEFPELFIVVLSTSFPPSVLPFADPSQQRGVIDIQERDLHSRIGGSAVAAYGDHGSVHSVVYDDTKIMRWSARIDYPRELSWHFERRPGEQGEAGYISAATSIVATDPEIGKRGIWGEEMIVKASQGEPHGRAPAPWIAVRVNIHLARQLAFSQKLDGGDDNQAGDDDGDGFDE